MRSIQFLSISTLLAFSLTACGSPNNDIYETDTAEAVNADPEVQEKVTEPEPSTYNALLELLESARGCDASTYSAPSLDMPARAEGTVDADYNAIISENYIALNGSQPCVFTTPSGLQFTIHQTSDDGISPVSGEMVTVHYRGQLIDGTEFDSSYSRGEPATFPSDRLIAGWVEALPLMRTGETWTLYIAPDLGYGARGTPGGPIGPNQALVFDLELLDLPGRSEE